MIILFPGVLLSITNVFPHRGSRGPAIGAPFPFLANLVGIARNLALRGLMTVLLPLVPMWILAYGAAIVNVATEDDPPAEEVCSRARVNEILLFKTPD